MSIRLLNAKQLAASLGNCATYVTAMRRAGYRFTHSTKTTLESAHDWLAAFPQFRASHYLKPGAPGRLPRLELILKASKLSSDTPGAPPVKKPPKVDLGTPQPPRPNPIFGDDVPLIPRDAALALGVSLSTMNRLIYAREVASLKVAGLRKVRPSAIRQYLARRETKAI